MSAPKKLESSGWNQAEGSIPQLNKAEMEAEKSCAVKYHIH